MPVWCQAPLLCAVKLTEAGFPWISLPHSLTLPVPSCTPVPLLLPAMSPGACASPLADWRHPGAAALDGALPPVGAFFPVPFA